VDYFGDSLELHRKHRGKVAEAVSRSAAEAGAERV
jgi:hypothetical protein